MTEEQNTNKRTPKSEDRVTVVMQAHHQDWHVGNTTSFQWSYERFCKDQESPIQMSLRVNPGQHSQIALPGDSAKYEIFLGHRKPIIGGSDAMFAEQQDLNEIQIYSDDTLIASIAADRLLLGQFHGKLTAKSTRATALLQITAFPL
jgi:hypothetical protein